MDQRHDNEDDPTDEHKNNSSDVHIIHLRTPFNDILDLHFKSRHITLKELKLSARQHGAQCQLNQMIILHKENAYDCDWDGKELNSLGINGGDNVELIIKLGECGSVVVLVLVLV